MLRVESSNLSAPTTLGIPRPEVPVWLNVPAIESRRDVAAALRAVASGVAQGEITSAQGLRLVRLYTAMYRYL